MTDTDTRFFDWFVSYYGAHFPKLRNDDGLEHWRNWLMGCSRCTLQATIDALGKRYAADSNKKPRLGEIKETYNNLRSQEHGALQAKIAQEARNAPCERCQDSGVLFVVVEQRGSERYLKTSSGGPGDGEVIEHPCHCSAGFRQNHELVPIEERGGDGIFEALVRQTETLRRGWEKAFNTKEEAEGWVTA